MVERKNVDNAETWEHIFRVSSIKYFTRSENNSQITHSMEERTKKKLTEISSALSSVLENHPSKVFNDDDDTVPQLFRDKSIIFISDDYREFQWDFTVQCLSKNSETIKDDSSRTWFILLKLACQRFRMHIDYLYHACIHVEKFFNNGKLKYCEMFDLR